MFAERDFFFVPQSQNLPPCFSLHMLYEHVKNNTLFLNLIHNIVPHAIFLEGYYNVFKIRYMRNSCQFYIQEYLAEVERGQWSYTGSNSQEGV